MKEGWLCPRCNKVNSPNNMYCNCNVSAGTLNTTCIHQWKMNGYSTGGTHYQCVKCGMMKTESFSSGLNCNHYSIF